MTSLVDADARRRITEDLDETFVVEAAAGTGKTTALVRRMVATLRAGRAILGRMAALTFTEKAAGEMKLRLGDAIGSEVAGLGPEAGEERARLERAAREVEIASIATIHAFCADILREKPLEAGIDPAFEVLAEAEQIAVLERVFRRWFEDALQDPPEALARFLRRERSPRSRLFGAVATLAEHRDYRAAWTVPAFERAGPIGGLLGSAGPLVDALGRASNRRDPLCQSLHTVSRVATEAAQRDVADVRALDVIEADLKRLARGTNGWRRNGTGSFFGPGLPRVQVRGLRDEWKANLDTFLQAADAHLAASVRELARPVLEAYEAEKARLGCLDFLDLLLKVRALVGDSEGARRQLQARFDCLFVDEFQDTDPLQAEILLLLSASDPSVSVPADVRVPPGKLFVVGDPKQSIYRFRRADMGTYEKVKRQLVDGGGSLLQLSTNFRSVPALQSLVNASFEPLMGEEEDRSVQAGYVPLQPHRPPVPGRPSVVCLPAPRPFGDYGTVFPGAIQASAPDAVGAFVAWLLHESGWLVVDPISERRVPVRSQHVCLLFRRMQSYGRDVSLPYARALEDRRIPLASAGASSFHDREEVMALRVALRAIDRPTDEFSVYATLRGPFFGFTDDVLLAAKTELGRLQPFMAKEGADLDDPTLEDALELIGELHRARNRRSLVETTSRFLEATRAFASLAHWPSGELALRSISRLLEVARRFEERHATSFRGFVTYLENEARSGTHRAWAALEESAGGVRLMTVHAAKGLEFPVVVLADPTVRRKNQQPSRYVDHEAGLWAAGLAGLIPTELRRHESDVLAADDAEEVRIAYVAATRARDLLVIPTTGESRFEGWVDVHHKTLYPTAQDRRRAARAEGCPEFGEDSVAVRGASVRTGPSDSVKPGFYPQLAGGAGAVWWDPSVLDLGRRVSGGVSRSHLFEESAEGEPARRAYEEWVARGDEMQRVAATPTRSVRSVTERSAEARDEQGATATSTGPAGPVLRFPVDRTSAVRVGRPHGPRFGTLVHAVLADVPLDGEARDREATIESLARTIGRTLGCPDEEIEAARRAAVGALAHPILERAAKSADVRREVQVVIPGEQGSADIVEGVIDLAFKEPSGWVVVDYKTDEGAADDRYHAQLGWYVDAVARATGRPTHGALLLV